jgi:hypothetical protein
MDAVVSMQNRITFPFREMRSWSDMMTLLVRSERETWDRKKARRVLLLMIKKGDPLILFLPLFGRRERFGGDKPALTAKTNFLLGHPPFADNLSTKYILRTEQITTFFF